MEGIIYIALSLLTLGFGLAFFHEKKKRVSSKISEKQNYDEIQRFKHIYSILEKDFRALDLKNKSLKTKEAIQQLIINCVNDVLEENSFKESLSQLSDYLRSAFQCEYCAIGKLTDNILEDYVVSYDKQTDFQLCEEQKNELYKVRKANLDNTCLAVCIALRKKEPIVFFEDKDLKKDCNYHYEIYKTKILKSHKLSNITVIPLWDKNEVVYGYIQFINSAQKISISDIEPFLTGLSQLIKQTIVSEKNKQAINLKEKFLRDSDFIKSIIEKKDDMDSFLDGIMSYFAEEFKAVVVSFRIPILNGYAREPLFYLRKCYVNKKELYYLGIEDYYYKNRCIKKQDELGGNNMLKCIYFGEVIYTESNDSDYYEDLNINVSSQKCIIMPILKDIDKNKCLRNNSNKLCGIDENRDCIDRFKKLYGLFRLRLYKDLEDDEVNEINERLKKLSQQITLILNAIADKYESKSIQIFRNGLKNMNFIKMKEFDEQIVRLLKDSTHAKECSIYRLMRDGNINENVLRLSSTTCYNVLLNDNIYPIKDVIHKIYYCLDDNKSLITKVFNEKKIKYLYNLDCTQYGFKYYELVEDSKEKPCDESYCVIPIVKKDDNCVGVILLTGKKEDKQSLSKSYWEQDIEFINLFTEIITRISEADNERMTFLNQLGHELLTPITEIVQQNDFLFNKYTLRKESFDKNAVMRQLQSNINNCLLFQYIISDIEHIYSSSVKDISYNIELQNEPWEILQDIVNLFRTSIPIKMSISQMPPMYLDKERIKQVFINILKNAIRYSYDGQQIEIYYKSVEYENVKMHEIKFVNYGIGILEEDKEHIFELYKRGRNATEKRASGSGMGLYIVQEIMKAHGGMCIIRKLKDPTEISLLFPYK